jgi:hypothetical protein
VHSLHDAEFGLGSGAPTSAHSTGLGAGVGAGAGVGVAGLHDPTVGPVGVPNQVAVFGSFGNLGRANFEEPAGEGVPITQERVTLASHFAAEVARIYNTDGEVAFTRLLQVRGCVGA